MRNLLLLIAVVVISPQAGAITKRYNPEQSKSVPVYNTVLNRHYNRIAFADDILENKKFEFIKDKSNRIYVNERPIILACFDERTFAWHTIKISIPYPTTRSYFHKLRSARTVAERENVHIPIKVYADNYIVEHIRGASASRLCVKVWYDAGGKLIPLTVYRIKYPNFKGGCSPTYKNVQDKIEAIHYTPISDDFMTQEFENEGYNFIRSQVTLANDELRSLKVKSRSHRGKLLGDIFLPEVVMSLMVSEQWDPLFFKKDLKKSKSRILCEYGLNRELSFAWSVSSANAIGCLQFTNAKGKGTYFNIVREYKSAKLKNSFRDGARDMHNIVKAAICLLDYDLSRSSNSIKLFSKNAALGGLYPISSYNGGPNAGQGMMTEIERLNGKYLDNADIGKLKIPHVINKKKGKGNTETPMYAKKYLLLMTEFKNKK